MGLFGRTKDTDGDDPGQVLWHRGKLTLFSDSISYKGERKALSGVSSSVDQPTYATRVSSTGWLIVDGPDFQWRIQVQGPHTNRANKAAAAINSAVRRSS